MSQYEKMIGYFSEVLDKQVWDEIITLFKRIASHKPRHWLLPLQAREAVRGKAAQAVPAAVAMACSYISIVLVDDMLDCDPRGEYQRIGAPTTANMACAFQAAGLIAISRCESPAEMKLAVFRDIDQMVLTTTRGQYWDVQQPVDEDDYWRIVETKSSPFFGTAMDVGAFFGGASEGVARQLMRIGQLYGEMIQIHDDLNDTMAIPANPDWLQGSSPLPILYARLVDHPERARFLELCKQVTDENALRQAQDILLRCGAVSYCVDQLLRRHRSAREVLQTVDLVRPELIESLLEEGIAPVRRLFEAVGESLPASFTPGEPENGA